MKDLLLKEMRSIAKKHNVKLIYDKESGRKNCGGSTIDTIWIFPSNKQWIKELCFWHELGHIISGSNLRKSGRKCSMSTLSNEGCAWEIGLTEAAKYGRKWDDNSEQMRWARRCLASYVHGEYDDLVYTEKNDSINNM